MIQISKKIVSKVTDGVEPHCNVEYVRNVKKESLICPECKGLKTIVLFVSNKKCEACDGTGSVQTYKVEKVDHNNYYTRCWFTQQENGVITCKRGNIWYFISDDNRYVKRGFCDGILDDVFLTRNVDGKIETRMRLSCKDISAAIDLCEEDYRNLTNEGGK